MAADSKQGKENKAAVQREDTAGVTLNLSAPNPCLNPASHGRSAGAHTFGLHA